VRSLVRWVAMGSRATGPSRLNAALIGPLPSTRLAYPPREDNVVFESPLSSVLAAVTQPAYKLSTLDRWAFGDRVADEATIEETADIGSGDDILAVDDNPANLIAIEAALSPLGRRVVFASSGAEALGKLLAQDFALILLDVAMPGMTGIETARLIRSRDRTRGTPIIFVTGMAWHDAAIDEAYDVGGFDFLIKPFRAEVLCAKARVFLTFQERTLALRHQAEELRESQVRLYEHELHEQRKRFESQLLDSKLQQLADSDRRHHELAAIIGSELLNPLQTLQMAFDLLREHPNAEMGERIYSLVEHRLVHVTRLVEGLIDVARVASGQLELTPETVNVAEIVRQALDSCRAIIETRKLTTRFDADTSVAPLVMGDPVRLLQAVSTLIDHAARSTPEHGQILATSRVAAGDVVVCITDTGRGIAPERLSTIFDMFVNDSTAQGNSRLRLGLVLVKRLIELHDGALCATSDGIGKGATFEVRLPLAPQDVELSSMDTGSTEGETAPQELFAQPTMRMAAADPPPDMSPDDSL
jgi:signal transduction histidine kinase